MKLINRLALILSTVSMVFMTSCDPEVTEKMDEFKNINVTVTSEDGLNVSWTDASNYVDPVTYTVSLALKGGNAEQVYESAEATSPWAYSAAELQTLLAEWNCEGDVVVNVTVNAVRDGSVVNKSAAKEVSATVAENAAAFTLSSDPLVVYISEEDPEGTAVTFSWTDENEHEASYRLVLKAAGNTATVEAEGAEHAFTNEALNVLALEELGLEPNSEFDVEVYVEAYAGETVLAASNHVFVTVQPYGDSTVYTSLSVTGTAVVDGTSEMTKGDDGIFRWRGELTKDGTVKILIDDQEGMSFLPSENKVTSSELPEPVVAGNGEACWTVSSWGFWEVEVNTVRRIVTFTQKTKKYNNIGIVGPATPNEWNAKTPTLLNNVDYTTFTLDVYLKAGTIRFLNDPDANANNEGWDVDQYIAKSKDLPITDGEPMEVVLAALGKPRGDNMWVVETPGAYRITLNVDEHTVLFERIGDMLLPSFNNVKLVGSATPGGWDAALMTPMEKVGEDWTWTGYLKADEIKFVCNQSGSEWGTNQILAQKNPQGVSEAEGLEYTYNLGGSDWKWKIRYSGTYTILITKYGKVKFTIVELDPIPDQSAEVLAENYPCLGLIGNAAPQGWTFDFSNSTLLPVEGSKGLYSWSGHLKVGDIHIMCDLTKEEGDWSSPRLTAPFDGIVVESGKSNPMVWKKNDEKWNISVEGEYNVLVNLNDMTITFTLVTE